MSALQYALCILVGSAGIIALAVFARWAWWALGEEWF